MHDIIVLLLNTENALIIKDIMSSLFTKRSFKFKEVIETHICSGISISDLSQLTNKSLSAFKKEFYNVYQDTPGHYIMNRKLEKVAELLLVSDDSVQDIAFNCGFKSTSHLSRSFKDKYHITPSKYRNGLVLK